ncbi:MAG: hypothetical protein WAN65_08670 [Candidatus Sulfotelmatobacter sp.]
MTSNQYCTDAKEKSFMRKAKAKDHKRHLADKFPPLDVDQEPEELFHDICERLRKVFEKYGCEPTPEGWQQLAVELMVAHEPAIKMVNSMQRMTDGPNFYALVAMHRKRKAEPGRAIADIAREVAKDFGKKAETLESRYSNEDKDRLDKRNLSEALTRQVSRRIALWRSAERISSSDVRHS